MKAGFQLNALDPNSLGDLKRLARENPDSPETLRAAARQFEALFLQMMLKSMRQTSLAPGMFDTEQSKTYQSLYDQQLALNMAHSGNSGLSDALFRQLGGLASTGPGAEAVAAPGSDLAALFGRNEQQGFDIGKVIRQAANPAVRQTLEAAGRIEAGSDASSADPIGRFIEQLEANVRQPGVEAGGRTTAAREFVDGIWPHAQRASRQTGIPAQFIVAQAALETGWGEKVLRHADGRSSHNLFNIKAGSGWQGESVTRRVTEFAGGRPYTEEARFRSYGSYGEAVEDYARLLKNSERYSDVLGQTSARGFARSLQQAGYATDPMYADKLTRIIGGTTLRTALTG